MTTPVKSNSLQSYQTLLYHRALHPEFFPIRARRAVRHSNYEIELWVMAGSHLFRFERGPICACELVTDQEGNLPEEGVVAAFLCAGERDFEHRFEKDKVTYMTSVQTETLSENLYDATFKEMNDIARRNPDVLLHRWNDETGKCISLLEYHLQNREVQVEAYHLVAQGGLVLRTQTIFEQAPATVIPEVVVRRSP